MATGYGEPAISAARVVSPYGYVVATDISSNMLSIAMERATLAEIRNIEFREIDAEELDFRPSSFNAVLSRWGLMFVPCLPLILNKIRSYLIEGGVFATAVWGHASRVPLFYIAFNVVARELGMITNHSAISYLCTSDPKTIETDLEVAGFEDVYSEKSILTFELPSSETYVTTTRDLSAPINSLLSNLSGHRREEIWKAIAEEAQLYADDSNGHLKLDNEVIFIVGSKKKQ